MKKVLLVFAAVAGLIVAQAQTNFGYTYIGQRYEWLAGIFKAMGLPVGDSARFQLGQHQRQGAVYLDTINTSGSPNGFYIYEDPTGGNSPFWNRQSSSAQICQNRLLTPWNVSYQGTGFNFSVHGGQPTGQGAYQLGCSFYTEDSATVTLNPSDPTLERIDVIYLDATGLHVREGDLATAGTAQKPTMTLDEIELTFVTVSPGATTPTLTQLIVWDENTESTVTNTGTTTDPNNLTNVFVGLKSVNVTNVNHNDLIHFDKLPGATFWPVLGYDALVLGVKLKPTMPINTSCNIAVSLVGSGGVEVIVPVTKTNNSTYQQISVPLSAFGNLTNTNIARVNVRYLFPTAPLSVYVGFYLDYIYFIDGLTQPPATAATFTLTMPVDFIVGPTNTQQSPGGWVVTTDGLAGQYYTKEGFVTLPTFMQSIGALDGQAKSVDGASVNGNELFMQLADNTYPGLLSAALHAKISRNDSVTNGTPGDTLLVKVNDSLLKIKALIPGTNIDFDITDDNITINSTGGGGPTLTQGEGIAISGDSIHLGGLVQAPSLFIESRAINTMREIMHWTNGTPPEIGGPIWQHSDRPYSPYQFISADTLTANSVDPPTAAMPVSGLFARRTIYYNPGIFTTQKVYGHYLGRTIDWADSMRYRTEAGDYNQAVIAESREMPRGTGAQRSGIHGTNNNNNPYYGVPTFLSNTILANSGGLSDGSISTIHTYGWRVGISSYLVAGALDTVERFSFYQTNNFLQASSRVKKLYGIDFQHNLNIANADSSYGIWDQYGYRHYLRGKTVFGTSPGTVHPWSTTDQVKVIGNVNITDSVHLGKASPIGDSTGMDWVLRRRTDGALFRINANDMAAFFAGGGAPDLQAVTDVGSNNTNPIFMNSGASMILSSTSSLTFDHGSSNQSFLSSGTAANKFRWYPAAAVPYYEFDGSALTTTRNVVWQDASGTVAYLSDITGGGTTETASEGLTKFTNDIQLGGTLTVNKTIAAGVNSLLVTGSDLPFSVTGSNALLASVRGTNSSSGMGLEGQSVSGIGISGVSTSGAAISAQSNTGLGLDLSIVPTSTNSVATVGRFIRQTSGTSANGIGGSLDGWLENSSANSVLAAKLQWRFTDITNGSEDTEIDLVGMVNGTPTVFSTFTSGGGGGLTQEQVEDVVGALFATDNGDGDFTYNDGTPDIAFVLKALSVTDAKINDVAWGKVTGTPTTLAGYGIADAQPLDADLTTIAGLTATTDNFMQAKAGAWASRTIAQVKTDLGLTGTNSGDQTITLTGDVTGSGTGSFAATIATGVIVDADVNASAAIGATKIADGTVTSAEFQHINTVTSNVQTQLDAKAPLASPTFTGTVTIPTPFTLGAVSVLPTGTELNFVDGVTSAIQTQLDGKASTTLNNLGTTSINADLLAAADNARDIGNTTNSFKDIYTRTLKYDGATSGTVTIAAQATGITPLVTTTTGTGYGVNCMEARQTSDFTGQNINTVQPMFATAHDVWPLQAATSYDFEGFISLTHGATSHSVGLSFELTGGASVTSIHYITMAWVTATGTNTASQTTNFINVATNVAVNAAGANATEQIYFKGTINMNAAGNVTPSYTFSSAPTGTCLTKAGSFVKFCPKGTNTFTNQGPAQ